MLLVSPSIHHLGGLGSYPSGYPYGWGLDGPHMKCEQEPEEDPHKAVKQVKLVTSKKRAFFLFKKPKNEEPAPQHPLCGVEHVEEAEELLDHSLE
jgi:hypothetical protein